MTRIGVLSDTHLNVLTPTFRETVEACFADCSMILHAGDLTDLAVLEAFVGREVHAVCGNMCLGEVRVTMPAKKIVQVEGFTIGLTHGHGLGYDLEDRLPLLFDDVDCIVYGHTHRPFCHKQGDLLLLNPGSFGSTGRYGAPGTYAILEAGATLRGAIHEVPVLS
jgi:putative phosphoesterase